jgi:hypothetical protein
MKHIKTILSVLLALAAVAQGGSTTHTVPYGPLSIPDGNLILVPQYDGTPGSLLSITLELLANATNGQVEWDNEDPVDGEVTLAIRSEFHAIAPNLSLQLILPNQQATTTVTADTDGTPDYIGSDSFAVGGSSDQGQTSKTLTNTALFSPYLGAGHFHVNLSALVFTKITTIGASGESRASNGQASGTVKVTYEWSEVPEPATMALLSLGGLAMLRRRR